MCFTRSNKTQEKSDLTYKDTQSTAQIRFELVSFKMLNNFPSLVYIQTFKAHHILLTSYTVSINTDNYIINLHGSAGTIRFKMNNL